MRGFFFLSILFLTLGVAKVQAGQKFVYQLSQFPLSASMTYEISQYPGPESGAQKITSKLQATYLGMAVGSATELTITNGEGSLYLDSRCRSPKSSDRNYNCYSSRFDNFGELLYRTYNGQTPELSETMTYGDQGVKSFKLEDFFPDADLFKQPLHNASSLFLVMTRPDFGQSYNGQVFYVAGNEEFYKVRFNITTGKPGSLDVRMDVLDSHKAVKGNPASNFPGRMIYSISQKKVTSIYINVNNREYVLRLR